MRKSKIEKRLPEPQHSKEPKSDGTSVRPAIAKPTVVCMCHHKPSIEFDVDKTSNQILKGFNGLSMPQAMSVIKLLIILIKQNCQVSLSEDVLAGQENHIDNL